MRHLFFIFLGCLMTTMTFAANTILILGDSLSAAHGMMPQEGWVHLLKNKLKENHLDYRVVNASVSGDTTSNGLERLPGALSQYHPLITIIQLGANDGLRGLPIVGVKGNLQEMINLAKKEKSQVLLIGLRLPPDYGVKYAKQFQQMFLELAKTNDIPIVPLLLNKIDEDKNLFQADGIHPGPDAQAMILDNVWPVLEEMLVNPIN